MFPTPDVGRKDSSSQDLRSGRMPCAPLGEQLSCQHREEHKDGTWSLTWLKKIAITVYVLPVPFLLLLSFTYAISFTTS